MAADTTRPITGNSEWDIDNADTLTNVMDVMTCSYNYDLYSLYHYTHPNKPIMGGESASCTTDRGYYRPSNATTGHVYADDDGCVVQAWKSAAVNAWDSGNFIWTGHDYKGEPTPFNWPDINSHFGILDIAGFEKDSTGYYRSWWLPSGPKFLKLVPGVYTYALIRLHARKHTCKRASKRVHRPTHARAYARSHTCASGTHRDTHR
jgi:hypothetical protein